MRLQRRPILLILGGTNLGKPMLAVNVLTRIGTMLGLKKFVEVTVEDDGNLDLSEFDVTTDVGVLLDGIGDALMLHTHQESLQGCAKSGAWRSLQHHDLCVPFYDMSPRCSGHNGSKCLQPILRYRASLAV